MKRFLIPGCCRIALLMAVILVAPGAGAGSHENRSTDGDRLVLNEDYPERYTVVKGDTLWDISAMFLRDPWLWPEIWNVNPQVENPHLIYPGDVLSLVWVDGKPQIRLERGGMTASAGERWEPSVRVDNMASPVPTIPFENISAFLSRAAVADKDEFNKLPHVAALRNALVAGAGDEVYVRGIEDPQVGDLYRVIRLGDPLRDPETRDKLGYEVVYVGAGTLMKVDGEVSKLMLNDTTRETLEGDRVVRVDTVPPLNFYPRGPANTVDGQIIAVKDGVSRIGQYQMVIINRGLEDGMEEGYVLSIWKLGTEARDRYARTNAEVGSKFTLPDERIGLLMVLKPEAKTSYALVMDAFSEIRVRDRIRNP